MLLVFGQSDLDIYFPEKQTFPGGGALNVAFHWRHLGLPSTLLTRVATDRQHYFLDFYAQNQIQIVPDAILKPGRAGSSDIHIQTNGDVLMNNWIEGIGSTLQLSATEHTLIKEASWLHTFLIDAVIEEIRRLRTLGCLHTTPVSGDFFDFEPFTLRKFRETLALLDLAFIGWRGNLEDKTMVAIRAIVSDLQKMAVVTLGSRGVMVYDARHDRPLQAESPDQMTELFFPVEPVAVTGTTIGCGDAFAAYFLAEWSRSSDLGQAVKAGMRGGSLATQWRRCLPDSAYRQT